MTKYLVISADTHAGLPNEQYREWLDPEYREQFDAALIERARMAELAQQGFLHKEFAEEGRAENEEGLRGGWGAGRPDKELDADGVPGAVLLPARRARRGGWPSPVPPWANLVAMPGVRSA